MLARTLENKFVGWNVENSVNHNSAISGADCEPIVGVITPIDSTSSNTANQRMGDRIRPKRLTVKGVISLNTAIPPANQNTIYVRVLIAAQKTIKVGSAVLGGSVDAARLLSSGFAGSGTDQIQFTGLTSDLLQPVNKNLFRVYMDKIIKLDPIAGGSVESIPGFSKRWSYTFKELPANLTYDEGNGDWANNFAPFLAIGYAYSDGASPDVFATYVKSHAVSHLEYEDA